MTEQFAWQKEASFGHEAPELKKTGPGVQHSIIVKF